MILTLMFASALATSEPSPAVTGDAPQRVPVSAPLKPGERRVQMVCRKEQKTDSRVSVRNCYDLADIEAREADDQRVLQEMQMTSPLN